MKKIMLLLLLPLLTAIVACKSDNEADLLSAGASAFITQYWPNSDILSVERDNTGAVTVIIKNGPTIKLSADDSWLSVNGNGMPLPQILLYDCLPTTLYDYLQSGEYLNEVFAISRDARTCNADILNGTVSYDISSGKITENRQ